MAGQDSDGDDEQGAEQHGIIRAGELQEQDIEAGAGNGGACLNVFFQDKRRFPRHDVSQNASADAGNHAEKNKQEMVLAIPRVYTGIDACDGKGAETDGVQNVHDFFIAFHIMASEQMGAEAEQQKQDEHRQKSGKYIDRVSEHMGRNRADHQVAEHSAADGGDHAEDDNAEKIQLFADCDHSAGRGKSDGSDNFYGKKDVRM